MDLQLAATKAMYGLVLHKTRISFENKQWKSIPNDLRAMIEMSEELFSRLKSTTLSYHRRNNSPQSVRIVNEREAAEELDS